MNDHGGRLLHRLHDLHIRVNYVRTGVVCQINNVHGDSSAGMQQRLHEVPRPGSELTRLQLQQLGHLPAFIAIASA